MVDNSTLAQIASIIAAVGAAMLFFRIQRELEMGRQGEQIWIPYADRLLIFATLLSIFLVILPIVLIRESMVAVTNLTRAACAAAVIMLGGYIPGILAHYRLVFGKNREGPRVNPEPGEKAVLWITLALALLVFSVIISGIV